MLGPILAVGIILSYNLNLALTTHKYKPKSKLTILINSSQQKLSMFNIPGVARAVLQTALSVIH